MRRADTVKEAKITHLAASALLFLSGIVLIAWPGIESTAVRYMVASGLMVVGAARMMGYFSNDLYRLAFQYDLAVGLFSIIMGILLIIYPYNLMTILPFGIGLYVLLDALLKLQTAFDAKGFGMKQWIGLLLSALVVSGTGVALLIVAAQWSSPTVLVGVALAADGAENFWNTMATVRVRAKKQDRYTEILPSNDKIKKGEK